MKARGGRGREGGVKNLQVLLPLCTSSAVNATLPPFTRKSTIPPSPSSPLTPKLSSGRPDHHDRRQPVLDPVVQPQRDCHYQEKVHARAVTRAVHGLWLDYVLMLLPSL